MRNEQQGEPRRRRESHDVPRLLVNRKDAGTMMGLSPDQIALWVREGVLDRPERAADLSLRARETGTPNPLPEEGWRGLLAAVR